MLKKIIQKTKKKKKTKIKLLYYVIKTTKANKITIILITLKSATTFN